MLVELLERDAVPMETLHTRYAAPSSWCTRLGVVPVRSPPEVDARHWLDSMVSARQAGSPTATKSCAGVPPPCAEAPP